MGEGASEGLVLLLAFPMLPGIVLLIVGGAMRRANRRTSTVLLIVGAVLTGVGVLPIVLGVLLDVVLLGVAVGAHA